MLVSRPQCKIQQTLAKTLRRPALLYRPLSFFTMNVYKVLRAARRGQRPSLPPPRFVSQKRPSKLGVGGQDSGPGRGSYRALKSCKTNKMKALKCKPSAQYTRHAKSATGAPYHAQTLHMDVTCYYSRA